jgi:hypothetical protein
MATDARGHTVPAATDHPSRQTLLNLMRTTRDITPVTNTAARAAVPTAMTAEGLSVAVTNPLMVARADARPDSLLEFTTDGSTWRYVPLSTLTTAWTPTVVSGLTVGNGVWTGGWWIQAGPLVTAHFHFAFGTTTSVTGVMVIAFPVAISTNYAITANCGSASITDASTGSAGRFSATCHVAHSAAPGDFAFGGSTSGLQANATNPMTWTTSDQLTATVQYLAA